MSTLTPEQDAERHQICGLAGSTQGYAIRHVDSLTLTHLRELEAGGYLSPGETQNDSPTVREFMEWMEAHPHPTLVAHGYLASRERGDCRISIEGLAHDSPDDAYALAFVLRFRDANEVDRNRVWWD